MTTGQTPPLPVLQLVFLVVSLPTAAHKAATKGITRNGATGKTPQEKGAAPTTGEEPKESFTGRSAVDVGDDSQPEAKGNAGSNEGWGGA